MKLVTKNPVDHTNLFVILDARRCECGAKLATAGKVLVNESAQLLDHLVHYAGAFGGTQQRSGEYWMKARDEWVRPGKLGPIHMVRTCWHSTWWTPGKGMDEGRQAR